MRSRSVKNGYTLKAYAGSTGVMLAMNVQPALRPGLLGFAIERQGPQPGRYRWLQGLLRFPNQRRDLHSPIESKVAPIQKFRWSDYCVYPESDYAYQLYAVYGSPEKLYYRSGPMVSVRTEALDSGLRQIVFNRAAAASQAYAARFQNANPDDPANQAAREWLSRGLRERLLRFIQQAADHTWALDLAIYEIEMPEVVELLRQAVERGVAVRVVYHGRDNDPQMEVNRQALTPLPEAVLRSRKTRAIFHHKFFVLSRLQSDGSRMPQTVLTGSTNFTNQAVYRQANVLHIFSQPDIAGRYLTLFERLFEGETPGDTKKFINASFPIAPGVTPQALFSPRSHLSDLQEVVAAIRRSRSDLLFCTAFNLNDDIELALRGDETSQVIRYGLQNSKSSITGVHRQGVFVTPAFLKEGLEGFLKESYAGQAGNIFIHLKTVVADFTTDCPTVITGSNNLSTSASTSNDENILIVSGDTGVADTYSCEMLRLYDHYRFRFNQTSKDHRGPEKRLTLDPTDSWTLRYFNEGTLPCLERLRFCK